jgi:hypothetical protein
MKSNFSLTVQVPLAYRPSAWIRSSEGELDNFSFRPYIRNDFGAQFCTCFFSIWYPFREKSWTAVKKPFAQRRIIMYVFAPCAAWWGDALAQGKSNYVFVLLSISNVSSTSLSWSVSKTYSENHVLQIVAKFEILREFFLRSTIIISNVSSTSLSWSVSKCGEIRNSQRNLFRSTVSEIPVSDRQNQLKTYIHHVQNGSGAYLASYPMGTRGSFPGGKAAESWSCTSTPPIRLHGVVLN